MTPSMTSKRLTLLASVFLCALGLLMVATAADNDETDKAKKEEKFWEFARVFAEVYHLVDTVYVEDRDPDVLFRAALDGMMESLDPHSSFMAADSFDTLDRETGAEFSGVGIHLTKRDGILTVITPIPGGPSARLGIQPWDRIVEIDGETTERFTMNDAVKRLTGPVGSEVKVKFWRQGWKEAQEFTIKREKIRVHNVYSKNLGDGVGIIRISKFSDRVAEDILQALTEFEAEGVRGLILDLRFNTGGLLDEAVNVSDLFLPPDAVIVSTRGRDGVVQQEFRAQTEQVVDWPIMVLVNRGSASASEIVAAALRDHKRGVIIAPKGERTFGKGSVQTVIPQKYSFEKDEHGDFRYGGYRLTTALYYTPSGETINLKGIKPDVEVELPENQVRDLLTFGLIGEPDLRGPEGEAVELPSSEPANPLVERLTIEQENATPIVNDSDSSHTQEILNIDTEIKPGDLTGDTPRVIELAPSVDDAATTDSENLDIAEDGDLVPKNLSVPVTVVKDITDPKDFVDVQLQEAKKLLITYMGLQKAA